MNENIKVTSDGLVRTIQFNRPQKMNALTHDMYARVVDDMLKADANPSVRVVVFKGTPGCFTAGNDLQDFVMMASDGLKTDREEAPVTRFLKALPNIKTPMVAIVDGMAVGVGVTMLMHFDLVYASKRATFRTPFTALGLAPEAASSQLMPRAIGHQQAAELLMLSKTITAKDAYRLGLVTRIYKTTKLERKAAKQIQKLADVWQNS